MYLINQPQLCTESISNAHSDSSVTNTKAEEESETECEEITETQKVTHFDIV